MTSIPWKRMLLAIGLAFVVMVVGSALGLSVHAQLVGYASSLFISSVMLFREAR